MTDSTDNLILSATIDSNQFQERCRLRFLNAAISVMSEVAQFTVGSTASPPSTTITLSGATGTITALMTVTNLSHPGTIAVGTVVDSVSGSLNGTITLGAPVSGTVSSGDILAIAPVSHAQRAAFAAALFKGAVDLKMLAMIVLANTTNRTNCLGNSSVLGGNILDSDMDFQINSVFTGISLSGW